MPARPPQHFDVKAKLSLIWLFGLVFMVALILGLALVRLLAGADGTLMAQLGLHWMAESCMLMLTAADPADRILAYALIALPTIILVRGISQIVGQVGATNRAMRQFAQAARPLPPTVAAAAAKAGLSSGQIVFIVDSAPLAFSAGLAQGRIYVTSSLVQMLGDSEALAAVLLHESYHLSRHDPIKMLLARASSEAFFFLPIAKELYQRYLTLRELAADQYATSVQGRAEPLAAALYQIATRPLVTPAPLIVAHVLEQTPASMLNARFDALLGNTNPYPARLTPSKLWLSGVAVGLALLLLAMTYAAHGGLVLATIAHWLEGFC